MVPELPKPMAPISGRPFLERQLDYWISQGITRFILSVGYRHESITEYFGNSYRNITIDYVIENEPLGTGGALFFAVKDLPESESFLLLNGDTFFESNLKSLIKFSSDNVTDWCFSLYRKKNDTRYMGIDLTSQGQITSFYSKNLSSEQLINGGVYWVKSNDFSSKFKVGDKFSLENDYFPSALNQQQRLFGIEFSGRFIDIGIPDDYHFAQQLFANDS